MAEAECSIENTSCTNNSNWPLKMSTKREGRFDKTPSTNITWLLLATRSPQAVTC